MPLYQFLITLSISELVYYPNDDEDLFVADAWFRKVVDLIDVDVNIEEIYERYYECPVDTGDILFFTSKSLNNAYILIDSFKEGTDQLDLVRLGVQVEDKTLVLTLKEILRKLYDKCRVPISYKEGQGVLYNISKFENYPKKIYGSNGKVYLQRFKEFK